MFFRKVLLVSIFIALPLHSIEVNEDELDLLQSLSEHADDSLTFSSSTFQTNRGQAILKIWQQHRELKSLQSVTQPTSRDIERVTRLRDSNNTLEILNPDHPNHFLQVVNIAKEAATTEYLWQINSKRLLLEKRWRSGNWNWYESSLTQDKIETDALTSWIDTLNPADLKALANSFIAHIDNDKPAFNQILATLAIKTQDSDLLELLWQQPADQFSYMALQATTNLNDLQAISVIKQALRNAALQSQALILLSKHYAHYDEAQSILLNALKTKNLNWHAAMAMKMIKDKDVSHSLAKRINGKNSKVEKLAVSNLIGDEQ